METEIEGFLMSAFNQQHPQEEMEARPQKHWLCNELVWELCKEIPTAKTSDQILLTARNMYAYLEPRFSKKLIYRKVIDYFKTISNPNKYVQIRIDQVIQTNESEPIVVINQGQLEDGEFQLKTDQFRVRIWTVGSSRNSVVIYNNEGHFENTHLLYFLRLIAPLVPPIQLHLDLYDSSDDLMVHFMDTQSDWIDSIGLREHKLNSDLIYETLSKYNNLKIIGELKPVNVLKLIQWLTSSNNNVRSKKYLVLGQGWFDDGLVLFMDQLKKEFTLATNKSRFVVRLILWKQLDEFTLCNGLTGERLELRFKYSKKRQYIHALSRFPSNELDYNENDYAELDTFTEMFLRF